MKVILKEDVDNLGEIGTVLEVSRGYARNYLIPKKLAAIANQRSIKAFEHTKRIIDEKIKKLKLSADDMASKLARLEMQVCVKAGEDGKLFGSVTVKDIVSYLTQQGYE
ncbi:MAG: 50S ribosomal protein L9, partial [Candidatus Magnetoovum sp. WYHC-5]|nr:50S ribosomal protein L9 [Candidatus Magnetoovum sp. WYHC-5]